LVAALAGCTTYYKVSDPGTGQEYYTTKVKEQKGGAIKFEDEKTGSHVTMQSSVVKEIPEEEYRAAVPKKK
jgi:hypothetical protein